MARVSIENIKDLDPRRGYLFCDFAVDDPYMYVGYENSEGQWFIMRLEYDDFLEFYETTYTKGTTQYAKGWLHKDELTYDFYNRIF